METKGYEGSSGSVLSFAVSASSQHGGGGGIEMLRSLVLQVCYSLVTY